MALNEGKTIVGIPIVGYLTGIVMRFPSDRFDKQRFAPVVALVIAVALSITENYSVSHIGMFAAILRGLAIAMGAAGAYEIKKNYFEPTMNKKEEI